MAVRCPPYVPPRCCCGRMVILRSLVTTGAIFLYGLQEAHGQDVAADGGITCPEIFQTPGLCLSDNNELQGENKLTCTAGDIEVRYAFHWTTQRPLSTTVYIYADGCFVHRLSVQTASTLSRFPFLFRVHACRTRLSVRHLSPFVLRKRSRMRQRSRSKIS